LIMPQTMKIYTCSKKNENFLRAGKNHRLDLSFFNQGSNPLSKRVQNTACQAVFFYPTKRPSPLSTFFSSYFF
jgi:hypothetical protein